MLTPTAEQRAIITAGVSDPRSLMVTAYAGCAKTSTLSLLAWSRYETGARDPALRAPALYIVFNTKNKKEAEGIASGRHRFPPNVAIRTINGLGHAALGRGLARHLVLDDRKLGKLVTAVAKAAGCRLNPDDWSATRELVTSAMQAGLVPKEVEWHPAGHAVGLVPDNNEVWQGLGDGSNDEDLIALARRTLIESIKLGLQGTISFDDQIYLSCFFGGAFTRYSLVLLDEAQDQNPLNILMLSKVAANRIIAVGDPKQSIYQWRGAAPDAMDQIRKLRPEWLDLSLATTFRCPKTIVARQQGHAKYFQAHESNATGTHIELPRASPWTWATSIGPMVNGGTCAVLCRNNAPLLSLAFKLLRAGIPISMLGRDLGKGLVALSKKLLPSENTPRDECFSTIREWAYRETSLAEANDQPTKAESIRDRADGLLIVLNATGAKTSFELRSALEALFAREGRVTLSSIHRAKGLEWDTVVHLDPWRIPSRRATGPSLEQERNLRYVAETRAKQTLIEANLADFQE